MSKMVPFNVDILVPTEQMLTAVGQIKVLDIFEGASKNSATQKNFHPEGLFSVEIFGKVGEERRNRAYGYIDLQFPVLHPIIYRALVDTKALYGDIMSGKKYARFDKDLMDFVSADITDGDTGYMFFTRHIDKIKFEERPSAAREMNIKMITKFRNRLGYDKLIVLPAGMRDYSVDDNGKPTEDQINGMYRRIIGTASTLQTIDPKLNIENLDRARFGMQKAVNEVYDYLIDTMDGKNKLIQGKFAARKIVNSTRNVITSNVSKVRKLHDHLAPNGNQTVVGIHQFMRAILPLAIKRVRDSIMAQVFPGPNAPMVLVNKRTLKRELVPLNHELYDEWMTYEGLEMNMARFKEESIRHDALETKDHYFALVYADEGQFKVFNDIDELPENFDKANVHPMTLAEAFYISVYDMAEKIAGFVTRYPVAGYGGIYPSFIYLRSTSKSKALIELDHLWNRPETERIAKCFPIIGESFFDSMSPAREHMGRLVADFDGDMCSLTCVWTEDAMQEITELLNSASYYVGVDNTMAFSADDDVVSLVLASMTTP